MAELTYTAAFIAGLVGFASPCVLPLVPSYLAYLSGVASQDLDKAKPRIFLNTLAFVLGLALALTALGFALGALLELLTGEMILLASRISGAMMVIFGLHMLGIIRNGFFGRRHGMAIPQRVSLLASFSIGMLFAVVWTPVMGAFLSFVISLAVSAPHDAPFLLLAYACGLGLPFLIIGAFASQASAFIKMHAEKAALFERAMGLVVVVIGILFLLGGVPFL